MKQKRIYILLFFIMLISLCINLLGIGWGLPGQNIINLIFGNEKVLNALVPIMAETRQEIRQMIKSPGDEYRKDYDEDKIIKFSGFKVPLTVGKINAMRTYLLRTYYPDEHITLAALSNINPKEKKFSPKVLIPGCFYVYATGLWLGMCNFLQIIKLGDSTFYLEHPGELKKVYLSIRILLILAFLFSIYFVWSISNNLWGPEVGLVSSFLFGICPALNMWNHFGYYYGFALPFVLLSFLYGLKIISNKQLKYYLISAIFASIAMSVVSLYGVCIMFMITAGLISAYNGKREDLYRMLKNSALGIVMFIVVVGIIHIFLILDKETFLKVLKFEGGDFKFSPDFFYFVFASLKSGAGWPFLLSFIAGYILLCMKERNSNSIFLITSIIVPLVIFSCFSPWYVRRGIFLMPFMAMFAGIFLIHVIKRIRIIGGMLTLFVLILTFFYSGANTRVFAQENIREEAGRWINMNIPEKSKIGMLQMPAPYRTPSFQFYRYDIIPVLWDKEKLETTKPDYFIISEYETLWQTEETLGNFFLHYYTLKKFQKPASFFGITFNRTKFSAKDVWVANPYIIIYKRKYVEE